MAVFGWIVFVLLALFGLFVLGLIISPYIIARILGFKYKVKTLVEDNRVDTDKRSEARQNRQELKRQKDFELANKKLDAKLRNVDKKIKIQTKKLELSQKLEKQLLEESVELDNQKKEGVVEKAQGHQPRHSILRAREVPQPQPTDDLSTREEVEENNNENIEREQE